MSISFRRSLALSFVFLLPAMFPFGERKAFAAERGRSASSGSVMGTVYDQSGKPVAGALIVILRQGAAEIVKQARTGVDGRFMARLAAGSYSLRAAAEGFQTVAFEAVQITPSSELIYRFNLEPIGAGRTAPERRLDRNETKWRLRAAQGRRSIFQISEQRDETVAALLGDGATHEVNSREINQQEVAAEEETPEHYRLQGVVETYAAMTADAFGGGSAGLNFAVSQPLPDGMSLILAGQTGIGAAAQRLEATISAPVGDRHRVSFGAGGMRLGSFSAVAAHNRNALADLGQISLRALDEWTVRDGVIVVLGMDYSRLTGAQGGGDVFSPRVGLQYDLDSLTRLRAAYAPGGGERVTGAAQFEDNQVIFHEARLRPVAVDDQGQALLEKSRRLEIGIERELDLNSSVEATAFFDTTENRGIGLLGAPISAFAHDSEEGVRQVAQQQGAARGLRVLYSRRLNSTLKASAGYSFGRGQALSAFASDPAKLWTDGFFQTAAAQVEATLSSGTRVRTIFRFSPRATVFAIDPFAGRLAVYDPSLSFYVTQELPAFGLPIRAEAVLDARNLLDAQTGGGDDGETAVLIGMNRRSVRGGISLRF